MRNFVIMLCLSFVTFLSFELNGSAVYSINLAEILEYSNSDEGIVLKDGTKWLVRNDKFRKIYYWSQTDDLLISKNNEYNPKIGGQFILKNCRTGESFLMDFDLSCLDQVHLSFIQKIDLNGYFVVFDNQLEWVVSWYDSWISCQWRRGDEMIFYKNKDNSFLLINVSTLQCINAQSIVWKE